MVRLALLPDPTERAPTVWKQCQFGGAQSNLGLAVVHLVRHSSAFQRSGSDWDRHMAEIAMRDCREALDEFARLLEPEARQQVRQMLQASVAAERG